MPNIIIQTAFVIHWTIHADSVLRLFVHFIWIAEQMRSRHIFKYEIDIHWVPLWSWLDPTMIVHSLFSFSLFILSVAGNLI